MDVARLSAGRRTRIGPAIGAALAVGVACAAKQRVPLDCVPERVTVYVDQRALEELPLDLELRRDEPHTVFFKGAGYEPRMIVLEPRPDVNGRTALSPDRICVELVPIGVDRQLELEVEGGGDSARGASGTEGTTP